MYKIRKRDPFIATVDGVINSAVTSARLSEFNSSLLGLGDISKEAIARDCIACVFDLEGFTQFCRQIEPHLIVPNFLQQFLDWIFEAIREEMKKENVPGGSVLWSPLPFYCKFMGDGMLVLWDSSEMTRGDRRNIVISAASILRKYVSHFCPSVAAEFSDIPARLRGGLARGTVFTIGNGKDYVGSCINMAARLQKLPGISFAFNRRGFDVRPGCNNGFFEKLTCFRLVQIRGIGENELVGVFKNELKALSAEDAEFFRVP